VLAYVSIADWEHEIIPRSQGHSGLQRVPTLRSIGLTFGFSYGSAF
jgi:hypothetical protein